MLYKDKLKEASNYSGYTALNGVGVFIPYEDVPIIKELRDTVKKQSEQIELQRVTINKMLTALKQRGIMK